MAQSVDRFQGWSGRYAGFRPTYPDSLIKTLSHLIIDQPPPPGGVVADVGSGTGIFTRQLRTFLPDTISVLGIEPASDMELRPWQHRLHGPGSSTSTEQQKNFPWSGKLLVQL